MKEYLYKGLLVLAATMAPIKPLLLACGTLIIADMVTGIMAARKRKEPINSADMRRSLSKMVVYQVAIISAFVLETYMLEGLLPVTKVVGGVIGMVEFKSILENASTIAGQDIVKMVLDKLGSKNAKGLK
jgi:phage-related holin